VQQLDAGYLRQSGLMMSWRESRSYRRAPIAPFTRSAVSGRLSDPHSGCIGEGIGDRSNGGAVLKVAALAGHGLVCLPIYLGDLLRSGRLVTVLDDYTPPPLTNAPQMLFKPIQKNLRQDVLVTAELTLVGTPNMEHIRNRNALTPAILSHQGNLTMDSLPTGSTQSWLIVAAVAFSPVIVLLLADAIGWLIRQARGKGGVTTVSQDASGVRQ
jgi:hypothetical protein